MTIEPGLFGQGAVSREPDRSQLLARSLTRRLRFVAVLTVVFVSGLTAVFLLLFHEVESREQAIRTTYEARVALEALRGAFDLAAVPEAERPDLRRSRIAEAGEALSTLSLVAADDDANRPELERLVRFVRERLEAPDGPDDADAVDRRIEAFQADQEADLRERVAWIDLLGDGVLYGGGALGFAKVLILGVLLGQAARMARRETDMIDERTILLRELNHRVGNSLAIAVAFLQLQAAQIRDPRLLGTFREAQNRIMALGEVHRRLLQAEAVTALDLSTLLPGLAGELARTLAAEDRVSVRAAPAVVPVETAVALAIIMTELTTNAVLHGCRGDAGCDVLVRLDSEADGSLGLSVRDSGGRLPKDFDPQASGKAGLRIVTALVEQVGGSLSYRADGFTEARVRVPAGLP
ncbi:sensor histidine kinase [Skermanella mucosa]|uniref:sensor histidine kinase n=1 Tax=Skermanella mucosa TaxID=1789672 RepID=UPI00192ABAB7|nr:sensor histidine kinase [Skermanella mucosa]UEM21849.1 sensor histidine kinase [Skermanella mucosa]